MSNAERRIDRSDPATDTNVQSPTRKARGWRIMCLLNATVLFAAAFFKAANVTEILASDGLLNSKPLLLGVIGFEVLIGGYLIAAEAWAAWCVSIATFGIFTVISCYAWLAHTECNCFGGQLGITSTIPLNVLVVGLSMFLRPASNPQWRIPYLYVAVATTSAVLLCGFAHGRDEDRRCNSLEFMLADMLVGKDWPLDDRVHPDLGILKSGEWLILVVRRDCEHCRELMRQHAEIALEHRNFRIAVFVAGSKEWPFLFGRLSFGEKSRNVVVWDSEPFVASPAIFRLSMGTVSDAADGPQAPPFLRAQFDIE